nr:vegetative cell wall protein gp1-like [Aegilops tauschii subsp. strangulata]
MSSLLAPGNPTTLSKHNAKDEFAAVDKGKWKVDLDNYAQFNAQEIHSGYLNRLHTSREFKAGLVNLMKERFEAELNMKESQVADLRRNISTQQATTSKAQTDLKTALEEMEKMKKDFKWKRSQIPCRSAPLTPLPFSDATTPAPPRRAPPRSASPRLLTSPSSAPSSLADLFDYNGGELTRPPLTTPYASPSPPFTLTARWPRPHLARASRVPRPAAALRSDRARLVVRTAPHRLLRPRSRSLQPSPRASARASPPLASAVAGAPPAATASRARRRRTPSPATSPAHLPQLPRPATPPGRTAPVG